MSAQQADPADYARYCGPVALAAACPWMTPLMAAHLLLAAQRERGMVYAPATFPEDIVLVLEALHVAAETADPRSGERLHSAPETVARARAAKPYRPTAPGEVRALIESWPAEAQPAAWESFHHRNDACLRLGDWLAQPGTWLVTVALEDWQHWIALHDGTIIAGGDEGPYVDRRVTAALRVLPS